jgi:hypothetical protein
VSGFALLAPVFLVFEIWQLVISERYVGIKQIARGADPREMGPGELIAFAWSCSLMLYGAWMLALLLSPSTRIYGLCLAATTAAGYSVRRNCSLKLILVVLTFEGAVRVGILSFFSVAAWRVL